MPGGNRLKLKRQHDPKHVQMKIAKSQAKPEKQEPEQDVDLVEEAEKKESSITTENGSTVHISGNAIIDENGEKVEFEDEFGDDEEEEVVDGKYVVEAKTDEDYENGVADEEEEDEEEEEGGKDPLDMSELKKNLPKKTVYLPSDGLDPEDELEYDPSAYDLLYRFTLDWPSLSFDFIKDNLGATREAVCC